MEAQRIATLAAAVRESTLKRLRNVPEGAHNRRADPGAMSFADLAQHLADSDRYLFGVLEGAEPAPVLEGVLGADRTRGEYEALLAELERLGAQRAARIGALDDNALERPVRDPRFGDTTLWWVVARGCLDHETHHRGQLAAWLRDLLCGSRPGRISEGPSR